MRSRKEIDKSIQQKVRKLYALRQRRELLDHMLAVVRLAKLALAE